MKSILSSLKIASLIFATSTVPGLAQATPLIGQVTAFGNNYCPLGWANAEGQLLSISENDDLFSILEFNFGGDGRTTFGLPDLRGRLPVNAGTGAGLNTVRLGEKGGSEGFTLNTSTMASHNHAVNATNAIANKNGPGTDILAIPNLDHDIYHEGPANKVMDPGMISQTGQASPYSVAKVSPYLGMTWCVALEGVYPSRN
jgi:microcystin-dependent protein